MSVTGQTCCRISDGVVSVPSSIDSNMMEKSTELSKMAMIVTACTSPLPSVRRSLPNISLMRPYFAGEKIALCAASKKVRKRAVLNIPRYHAPAIKTTIASASFDAWCSTFDLAKRSLRKPAGVNNMT